MTIVRFQTSNIIRQLNEMPAIALLGPRQIGKTTLAQEIGKTIKPGNTLYLDLESPADVARLADAELYLSGKQEQFVIIDEVQRMPELFPLLRSLIDRNRQPGRFLLLGSASPELLAKSSETLAGRIFYEELQPFTWPEVKAQATWQQLWLRGGFPQMLLAKDDLQSFERRTAFTTTYLERELPLLGLSASPVLLRRMLQMLAHIQASEINYAALSRSLGIELPTVQRYLNYFEGAFIIRRLQPWLTNAGKRLTKAPKVFIRDTGLLHAVGGIETMEELEGFIGKGASWESFIIQQIIARLKPAVQPYYYRTQDGTELDLVLVKGVRPVLGIEIKYSNAPKITKGTTIASQDLGDIPVMVITPSSVEDYAYSKRITVTNFERMWENLAVYLI